MLAVLIVALVLGVLGLALLIYCCFLCCVRSKSGIRPIFPVLVSGQFGKFQDLLREPKIPTCEWSSLSASLPVAGLRRSSRVNSPRCSAYATCSGCRSAPLPLVSCFA